MNKKFAVILIILSAVAVIVAACAPSGATTAGNQPVAGSTEPTSPPAADTNPAESKNMTQNQGVEGTRWLLLSYLNADGKMTDVLADSEATAEFGPDGQLSGSTGCNRYFASYTVDGEKLTIGQGGSTMMACEPTELMQQEADFLAALQNAATFTITGDQLEIRDANNGAVALFQPSQPASLTGTEWTATMVNNGREAVTNLIEGTTITAVFSEDGKLNGSASCNNYMTGYTLDGQNITIDPPATTRKLCPEPEGVMEQEAAFTLMLEKAATYSIRGNVLELRTAEGALIVSFAAAN